MKIDDLVMGKTDYIRSIIRQELIKNRGNTNTWLDVDYILSMSQSYEEAELYNITRFDIKRVIKTFYRSGQVQMDYFDGKIFFRNLKI